MKALCRHSPYNRGILTSNNPKSEYAWSSSRVIVRWTGQESLSAVLTINISLVAVRNFESILVISAISSCLSAFVPIGAQSSA